MSIASHDPSTRMAGQYTRMIVQRLRMRTLVTLGILAVLTTLLGSTFGLHDPLFLGSELALLATMFVVSHYVLPLVDRHDRGAQAEEQVGNLLEGLPSEDWHVIHDASFGRGNVDHILIGLAGVFTIETKSHPGPVRVRRVHGATISQARAQQEAIERITGERVEPLVVFSRAWVDRPLGRRHGVRVVPSRMLLGYLLKRQPTLTPREVERAYSRVVAALEETAARRDRPLVWPPLLRSNPRP